MKIVHYHCTGLSRDHGKRKYMTLTSWDSNCPFKTLFGCNIYSTFMSHVKLCNIAEPWNGTSRNRLPCSNKYRAQNIKQAIYLSKNFSGIPWSQQVSWNVAINKFTITSHFLTSFLDCWTPIASATLALLLISPPNTAQLWRRTKYWRRNWVRNRNRLS